LGTGAFATTHVITQESFTFNPNALSVEVGDIVQFVWTSGSHTTTSLTVPAGAASWDAALTSANPLVEYTVTTAGTYAYVCTPHAAMGMVGGFVAVLPNRVANLTSNADMNVSMQDGGQLRVKLTGASCGFASIGLLDIMGRNVAMIHQGGISSDDFVVRYDVSSLQRGIYFVRFQEGAFVTTRKVLIQ
ncbi:MAG: plastocyanin/azurin family copper-binding protein, partial [Flavobacteriales bacterium]